MADLLQAVALRDKALLALGDVAASLLGGARRDDVLYLISACALELVSADLASVVLPHPLGGIEVPVAAGPLARFFDVRRFPSEGSLAEKAMNTGETIVSRDLSAEPTIGERAPTIGPAVFVPFSANVRFGCLTLIRQRGGPPFTAADVGLLQTFASQAGVVLEHDFRRQREVELERAEEQLRIAETLQDSAIQEIYAASLRLSSALGLVQSAEAHSCVNDAIEGLDRATTLIRQVIFDLQQDGGDVS